MIGMKKISTNHAQEQEFVDAASSVFSRKSQATYASSKRSDRSKRQSVKDLEMLLEAFFVRIDATLNGLSTVRSWNVKRTSVVNNFVSIQLFWLLYFTNNTHVNGFPKYIEHKTEVWLG